MTLVIGMLHDNECIITADNMVTSNRRVYHDLQTATGHTLSPLMNDSAHKLFCLNSMIVSFSGDQEIGIAVIDLLKSNDEIKSHSSLIAILKSIHMPYPRGTTLMIGYFDTCNQKAHLIVYDLTTQTIVEPPGNSGLMGIGSGRDRASGQLVDQLAQVMNTPPGSFSLHQKIPLLSFFANQLVCGPRGKEFSEIGVGGVFFGVGINKGGISWQSPTAILIVHKVKNKIEVQTVFVAYQSSALFIASSPTQTIRCLINIQNLSQEEVKAFTTSRSAFVEKFKNIIPAPNSVKFIEIHGRNQELSSTFQQTQEGIEYFKKTDNKRRLEANEELRKLVINLVNEQFTVPNNAEILVYPRSW